LVMEVKLTVPNFLKRSSISFLAIFFLPSVSQIIIDRIQQL
jgi:hypothetical protein